VRAGFYAKEPVPRNDLPIDEEQKLKLRALGYIE